MNEYVHGYSARETQRLIEQSQIVEDLLHGDTFYSENSKVLEAGCGVGAQTVILARRNPGTKITSLDLGRESLVKAQSQVKAYSFNNVQFLQANILELPFAEASFDHIFVCFVLEHLKDPVKALQGIKKVLVKGGSVTVIEGNHNSFIWHPDTPDSRKVWQSFITAQSNLGHDPLIGHKLYPLLMEAGFKVLRVSPLTIYADGNSARMKSGAMNKILIPMIESGAKQALGLEGMNHSIWSQGIRDFHRVADSGNGTCFYSWFKAVAVNP